MLAKMANNRPNETPGIIKSEAIFIALYSSFISEFVTAKPAPINPITDAVIAMNTKSIKSFAN